jgi:glycoprotein endo-alpha-1,2-mannosidase
MMTRLFRFILHLSSFILLLAAGYPQDAAPGAYIAQPGDTLASIAQQFHLRPPDLGRLNGLPPGDETFAALLTTPLNPGTTINLPSAPATSGKDIGTRNTPDADPTSTAEPNATPYASRFTVPYPAALNHLGTPRFVLADYMLWYSPSTFDGTQTFDLPAAGPYSSSDPATIARQLDQAQQACLDGFSAHWYGPFEPVTTHNFETLLKLSEGSAFRHAALLLTNTWPGADEETLIEAIQYVLDEWADHPNYLRIGGKPLIIFTDMMLPWNHEAFSHAGWDRIRNAVDPNHESIWMSEGLSNAYTPLFEGQYVYRIDHHDFPQSWLKQPRFANLLRGIERSVGAANLPAGGLFWADTIAPGYDDTRAGNVPNDFRVPAPPFARDRRNGGYYADTWSVTAQTNGDFLIVKSFNEWVEGTAIEPSETYGDFYLDRTCEYANEYRTR